MLDTNLYDDLLYDENTINIDNTIYNSSDYWVDFWNGFKIPNNFVSNCMFKYLKPLDSDYLENRKTAIETNVYSIKKTSWWIEISWRIDWTNRSDLLENIEYFKKKIRNKNTIILKDGWNERIAKIFIDDIDFDENHYNLSFMRFVITASFRDYFSYNKTNKLEYKSITENPKTFEFDNSGLETHYIVILKYDTASNLDVTFSLNWVDLGIDWINSGDTIIIDTENTMVEKNGIEIVFWGILSKMIAWTNNIIISDNWWSREYNATLFYKKTLS